MMEEGVISLDLSNSSFIMMSNTVGHLNFIQPTGRTMTFKPPWQVHEIVFELHDALEAIANKQMLKCEIIGLARATLGKLKP